MPGTPLRLKMAISTQGHTTALKDGSIPIELRPFQIRTLRLGRR